MSDSMPAIVFMKSKYSRHSSLFQSVWDNLKRLYPTLRFVKVNVTMDRFDENLAPSYLNNYSGFQICLLLVPGPLWDKAMSRLGPNNPIELRDGVQILNWAWNGDRIIYVPEYDIRSVDQCCKWIDRAIFNQEFLRN